jgi:hypothetical protein
MGTQRIPEARTFAIEMARAVLPQIPDHDVSGMWQDAEVRDAQNGGDDSRIVLLTIRFPSQPGFVAAHCHVNREGGRWAHGDCRITFNGTTEPSWFFNCRAVNGAMEATLAQS